MVGTSYGRSYESNCFFRSLARIPWIPERRDGLARSIYNRLKEDNRFSCTHTLAEAPWRLAALIPGSGFSAYDMALRSNPVDLYGWEDKDEDLTFA